MTKKIFTIISCHFLIDKIFKVLTNLPATIDLPSLQVKYIKISLSFLHRIIVKFSTWINPWFIWFTFRFVHCFNKTMKNCFSYVIVQRFIFLFYLSNHIWWKHLWHTINTYHLDSYKMMFRFKLNLLPNISLNLAQTFVLLNVLVTYTLYLSILFDIHRIYHL